MPKPPYSTPCYRLHKPSGRAVVTLNGCDCYLGPHGSPQSHAEYERLMGEWFENGRRLPTGKNGPTSLSINELILRYLQYADGYYRKPSGKPTSEIVTLKQALKPLRTVYGHTRASDFGPLALIRLPHLHIHSLLNRLLWPITIIDVIGLLSFVLPKISWLRFFAVLFAVGLVVGAGQSHRVE